LVSTTVWYGFGRLSSHRPALPFSSSLPCPFLDRGRLPAARICATNEFGNRPTYVTGWCFGALWERWSLHKVERVDTE